ncbi:MAG: rod-binding protein [Planctomycetota bacterium]|nr:rod-binding protein [Planctomycetota bacterium]
MLDVIEAAGGESGALGAISGKNRAERARERARAAAGGLTDRESAKTDAGIREAAEGFVAVFMNQVVKSMRATVQENPALHGDNGEKYFQEMLDAEQAKTLAGGRGYGLTELVYQSLLTRTRVEEGGAAPEAGEIR